MRIHLLGHQGPSIAVILQILQRAGGLIFGGFENRSPGFGQAQNLCFLCIHLLLEMAQFLQIALSIRVVQSPGHLQAAQRRFALLPQRIQC